MNIVSFENVSKNYGFKPLFENVTLGLEDRDKIGIIGANGLRAASVSRVRRRFRGSTTAASSRSLARIFCRMPSARPKISVCRADMPIAWQKD